MVLALRKVALLAAVVMLALVPRGTRSALGDLCTWHGACEGGEYCGLAVGNATEEDTLGNGSNGSNGSNGTGLNMTTDQEADGRAIFECRSCEFDLCPPGDTSNCNLPCHAINGDCCSTVFRDKCSSREVFYRGEKLGCSSCDMLPSVEVGPAANKFSRQIRPTNAFFNAYMGASFTGVGYAEMHLPCSSWDIHHEGHVVVSCHGAPGQARATVARPTGDAVLSYNSSNCSEKVRLPLLGWSYSQDPSWQPDQGSTGDTSCSDLEKTPGFVPLSGLSLNTTQVGQCQRMTTDIVGGTNHDYRAAMVGAVRTNKQHQRWQVRWP